MLPRGQWESGKNPAPEVILVGEVASESAEINI